ncbi:MAG: transglycosylase domain-containing protein [Bacilli bacterium]|nr:transglycosylase domain-containing protein [Bacilli bacterium]
MKKEKKEKEKKPKKHRRRFRFFYWLVVLMVFFAICVFVAGAGFCYYVVKGAPEYNIDKMFEKEPSRLFDSKGNLFATLGTEQREKVTYDQLPQVLVDAIIATEDSRFFQHNGFDAPRFIKASISQVLGHGGGGASTLTMQLSKLAFTSTESTGFDGIVRKFTDIYMAVFKMERNLTKEEIIEYYVNNPCMGGNIYGVQQASRYYFGKDVSDLNLVEAAQIAGMFQSPNGYNPYLNPNDANDRKNTVLALMLRHGYINQTQYDAGTSVHIKNFLKTGTTKVNEYQGFIDTVVQEVWENTGNNPYDVPMDIYTTMDKTKQNAINKFYKTYKFKDKKIEVGIGVINVKNGEIVAVGAGRNKTSAMTLNVATFSGQTKRMPGSTIKPILDYGPAIEYENLSTYGPFVDDKTPYGGGNMRNFNGSYSGFMTMRDCLKKSINTCALQAFRLTTNEQKKEFAGKLGFEFKEETIPDSYAIGAVNIASPVSLASAFSAFANNGVRVTPHSYRKIIYRETEEEVKPVIVKEQVMKPTTAYMITSVLQTATQSKVNPGGGVRVATKTGTTSYDTSLLRKYGLNSSVIPDSWTSSYTGEYAMAIWLGYTDGLTKDTVKHKWYMKNSWATTQRINIQATLAKSIYKGNSNPKNPGGLTSAKVELETIPAQKPSEFTPSKMVGTFMFVGNTGPSETSIRYAKLTDPSAVSYDISGKNINLSWTSPGIPDAINQQYLTDYFNKYWKIQTDKYLKKRIKYNKNTIGEFGFAIYLTQGSSSTYVGWTKDTTYTIDTSNYIGLYDGVIVKSMYSKFKSNASSGYRVKFETSAGEAVNPDDISISVSNLNVTLSVGDSFSPLTTNSIEAITYNDTNIKSNVSGLTIKAGSASNSSGSVDINSLTANTGTYKVNYTVSFKYKGSSISKTILQTVTVQ